MRGQQRGPKAVAPGRRGVSDPCLNSRNVDAVRGSGRRSHHDVHAGVIRLRYLHLRFQVRAGEIAKYDLLDACADVGGVAIARDVDHARPEARERILPDNQSRAAALVKIDDATHRCHEFGNARLEQFVPWVGFQNGEHGLAIVTRGIEPEVRDDLGDLAAQHRDLSRACKVCGRGPKAQKAVLADDCAARAELLHGDVVEIGAAMHGRYRVRLGDHEGRRVASHRAHGSGQTRWRRLGARLPGSKDAQARACVREQLICGLAATQPVVPIAEEDKMRAFHPVQKLAGFMKVCQSASAASA